MPVPQHVLNWLYSVLTSEYHDVNRTYNDVAHALTRYPSLAPRTDVHTFSTGNSALLLLLSGTLPVNFRGNTYRFPLSIWVPHAYPREPPLIYITPTETMMIRPGQHVDAQGQVYHPYLVGWAEFWDKSTIHDFLAILSEVFAKEPPVIARPQQQQRQPSHTSQTSQPAPTPPPVPPLPREAAPRSQSPRHDQPRPPPPPPKTTHDSPQVSTTSSPLPSASAARTSRYDSAPPLPPEAHRQGPSQSPIASPDQLRHHPNSQQQFPGHHRASLPPTATAQPPPGPQGLPPQGQPPYNQYQQTVPQPPAQWHPAGPGNAHPPHHPQWAGPGQMPHQQPAPPKPPPDLLDEPLTLDLPDQSSVAPPPIPPNPEKDALLRQLAQTLASQRQHSRQQNESSLAGLQAQRNALLSTIPILQSEMGQLKQLSNVLTSNTTILHDALRKADGVIEGSRSHPAPDIDELLVAPTVVANQLYNLVAEERALGDAIFMLGRAVERGRITPVVFAKMTRSLAREWYLKKALVRKIGLGMGLSS